MEKMGQSQSQIPIYLYILINQSRYLPVYLSLSVSQSAYLSINSTSNCISVYCNTHKQTDTSLQVTNLTFRSTPYLDHVSFNTIFEPFEFTRIKLFLAFVRRKLKFLGCREPLLSESRSVKARANRSFERVAYANETKTIFNSIGFYTFCFYVFQSFISGLFIFLLAMYVLFLVC